MADSVITLSSIKVKKQNDEGSTYVLKVDLSDSVIENEAQIELATDEDIEALFDSSTSES